MALDGDDLDMDMAGPFIKTETEPNTSLTEKIVLKYESGQFSDLSSDESDTPTILFQKSADTGDYISSYQSFLKRKQAAAEKVLGDLKSSPKKKLPNDPTNPKERQLLKKPATTIKLTLQQYKTAVSMEPKVVLRKINFTGLNRNRLSRKFNYILKPKGKRFIIMSLDKSLQESPKQDSMSNDQQESIDVHMSDDCAQNFLRPNQMVTKMPTEKKKTTHKRRLTDITKATVSISRLPIENLPKKKLSVNIEEWLLQSSKTHAKVGVGSSLDNSRMEATGTALLNRINPEKLIRIKRCSVKLKRLKLKKVKKVKKPSIARKSQTEEHLKHPQRKLGRINIAVQTKYKQSDAIIQTDNPISKKVHNTACQSDVQSKVDVGVQVKSKHYNALIQTDNLIPKKCYRNVACQTRIAVDTLLKEKAAAEKMIDDLKNEMKLKQEQHQKDILSLRTSLHLEQTRTTGLTDLLKELKPKENTNASQVVVNSEIPHTLLPRQPQRARSLTTYTPMAPKTYNFGKNLKNSATRVAFKPTASSAQNLSGIAEMRSLLDQQSFQTVASEGGERQSTLPSCRFRSNSMYIPSDNI